MSRPGTSLSSTGPAGLLPAVVVAIPIVILAVTLLAVLFAVAAEFGLTTRQISTLVVISYGASSILSIALSLTFRQPIFFIFSITCLVFMASLADTFSYREMLGATFIAGLVVALLGLAGFSTWLARVIPTPIVLGVLAGLVMPFVVRIFSDMQAQPIIIGATLATFILGRRILPSNLPPLLPALVVGILTAIASGDVHGLAAVWELPTLDQLGPIFSWRAILAVTPVLVVLMSPLANVSAIVMLRSQQFNPPTRVIDVACGAATMVSSFFAPVPINMGNFVTLLTAGPEAGAFQRRYWSVLATSGALLVVALTASVVVAIPRALPLALLSGVAGLALLSVLNNALTEVTRGPLRIGPLFAFVVASSPLSLGGFGPAFWALVIGMAISLTIEYPELRALRAAP